MDVRQLKMDVRNGGWSPEQLIAAIDELHQTTVRLRGEVERLKQRLAQYEPEVAQESPAASTNAPPCSTRYSLDAEEKRRRDKQRRKRRKKKSPGRRATRVKFAEAHHTEDVYPPDTPRKECQLVRERAVWRLV